MSFYKTANLILGEAGERPKFEKLNPKKYKRAYYQRMNFDRRDSQWGEGTVVRIEENGTLKVLKNISRDGDEAEEIRKRWEKATVVPGYLIARKIGFSSHELKDYNIHASYEFFYIVREDIAKEWGQLYNYELDWWLDTASYKEHVPKHVIQDMGKLMDHL